MSSKQEVAVLSLEQGLPCQWKICPFISPVENLVMDGTLKYQGPSFNVYMLALGLIVLLPKKVLWQLCQFNGFDCEDMQKQGAEMNQDAENSHKDRLF